MSQVDTDTPVLVLTTSSHELLHTPLAIARSLGRLGVAVHIAHPGPQLPYDRSRFVASRVAVRHDPDDPRLLLTDLLDAADRLGRPSVLVPVDDVAALYTDSCSDALRTPYLFPRRSPGLTESLCNKASLHRLCIQHDVPTVCTRVPSHSADVIDFAQEVGFPVVAKVMDPNRRTDLPSVTVARHLDELLSVYGRASDDGPPNLLLQEWVPGSAESVWMLNGYFDARSRCLTALTGVKLRQCPPESGPTSLGECRTNDVVVRQATQFLARLGYTGIVDLGCRYDPRDGRYKLLDVNPRIGATFRLFVDGEVDVVRAQYFDLTGQAVPPSQTPDGRRWLDEPHDLYSSMQLARQGLRPSAWVRSLHGVEETAWFAADDPVPPLAMLPAASRRAFAAFRRRTRSRASLAGTNAS